MFRLALSLQLLLFALAICCKAQRGSDSAVVYALLKKAQDFSERNLFDSSATAFRNVVALGKAKRLPRAVAAAYNSLGELMVQTGRANEQHLYDSLLTDMAVQLKDTALYIEARIRTGIYYTGAGKPKAAENIFLSVLNMRLEKEQSRTTADVYNNLASLYLSADDKNAAVQWFFKALKLYEKNGNYKEQAEMYSDISSVFYLMKNIDEAIGYQKESIAIRERLHDVPGMVKSHLNISQLYILKDSLPAALRHLQKSLLYAEQTDNPLLKGSVYSGMAAYYRVTKDPRKAIGWQSKAIKLFEEIDNKPLLSRLYASAGNLANEINDSVTAIAYYSKSLDLGKSLGNKENVANTYQALSTFYQSRGNYTEAYNNYKQYIAYRDSIAEKTNYAKIEEIKTQYETEKKDNEILRLNTEQKVKQLQIEKQKAVIAGNALAAQQKENEITLLSQQQQLRDIKIRQQEQALEKQALLAKSNRQAFQLARQEQEIKNRALQRQKLLRNILTGAFVLLGILGWVLFNRYQLKQKLQQQRNLLAVRNNIAKDLHDEVGSTLTSIKILSEVSKAYLHNDDPKTSSMLEKISLQSSQMQQNMSDIVWAITPDNDKLEDTLVRMREYISHTLEPKNIRTVFEVNEKILTKKIDMERRHDLFLIFKEAVNNIAKYAGASQVTIRLDEADGNIQLNISDNGCGFDTGKTASSNGLKNMKARAQALNGTVNIVSSSSGTTIHLTVPAT